MSDGFIAVLGAGFLAGIVLTLIMLGVSYGMDNKREHGTDTDMRIYVPSRSRNRGGDKRMAEIASEELGAILHTMGLTLNLDKSERAYIDEAVDRLERLDRLEKWVQGNTRA